MSLKQGLLVVSLALALALRPELARAQAVCRGPSAVELAIALSPPEVSLSEQLQRRLAAEFRAREIEVCSQAAGQRVLAHVQVHAALPELHPALVRVETDAGAARERILDLEALPREARLSAIASAADELLSALLETAAAGQALDAVVVPAALAASNDRSAGAPRPSLPAPRGLPRLELGLGGGAALFHANGHAYAGELLARWRPFSPLSATVRVGGDRARSESTVYYGESASGWHAGLDAGIDLLQPTSAFGVAAQAGIAVARVRRTREDNDVPTPVGSGVQLEPLGSSWESAASAGVEGSFRTGRFGVSLGLALLVPLTPTPRPQPRTALEASSSDYAVIVSSYATPPRPTGIGETFGGELRLRLWVALDG